MPTNEYNPEKTAENEIYLLRSWLIAITDEGNDRVFLIQLEDEPPLETYLDQVAVIDFINQEIYKNLAAQLKESALNLSIFLLFFFIPLLN